jgi:hypothetical protein
MKNPFSFLVSLVLTMVVALLTWGGSSELAAQQSSQGQKLGHAAQLKNMQLSASMTSRPVRPTSQSSTSRTAVGSRTSGIMEGRR